jgi:hypothetical protein
LKPGHGRVTGRLLGLVIARSNSDARSHYESLSGTDSVTLWKTVKSTNGLRKIKWNFPLVLSMK